MAMEMVLAVMRCSNIAMVCKCGQMEPDMKANGAMGRLRALEHSSMLMGMYIQAILRMTRQMDRAYISIRMGRLTRVSGEMISRKALGGKTGMMAPIMRATSKMARSMAM